MIEDSIRRFIIDELEFKTPVKDLGDDFPLLDRRVLDSLGLFELVGYLEDEYGVEIQDEELVPANFGTIRDIARLVQGKSQQVRGIG
jgi:acyl carrier protein